MWISFCFCFHLINGFEASKCSSYYVSEQRQKSFRSNLNSGFCRYIFWWSSNWIVQYLWALPSRRGNACDQMPFRASICRSLHGPNSKISMKKKKNQDTRTWYPASGLAWSATYGERETIGDDENRTKSRYIELFYRFNFTESTAVHLLFLLGIAASFVILFFHYYFRPPVCENSHLRTHLLSTAPSMAPFDLSECAHCTHSHLYSTYISYCDRVYTYSRTSEPRI